MNTSTCRGAVFFMLALIAGNGAARAAPGDYFGIRVVDDQTGRGVPLVELSTTYKARYYTDSGGYVAFLEPGLMDQEVWFDVSSYGYESPKGPYNARGMALHVKPGTVSEIKIHRNNIAERLYRTTGYGAYRDTALLGLPAPIERPLLAGQVTGSDTVQTAVFHGKMFWMWQDTNRVGFTLGNFSMTAATSALPEKLDPDRGIDFDYFVDRPGGFVRPFAHIQREGNNPIWVDGLMVTQDASGHERLLGRYYAANKDMSPAEAGLAVYNDDTQRLEGLKKIDDPNHNRLFPSGHPTPVVADGKKYFCFAAPYPCVRVEATFEAASDLATYEGYTCLTPGSRYAKTRPPLNRDPSGKLLWTWQRGAQPTSVGQVEEMTKLGAMTREESPWQMRDVITAKPVRVAGGSVAWSPFLKKWTFLFGEVGGASNLGEVWLATSVAPEGPWRDARKVATHAGRDKCDLYNPMQHPELARDNGRVIYFEGTLANTFSGNPAPVPYYDYNQLMYRLDLADPRMGPSP